jgi:predicted Zn-dependent protease
MGVLQPAPQPSAIPPDAAARNFVTVVRRVEPVAEQVCRQQRPRSNCDFLIVVDDRPGLPPNAFQTLDRSGRPVIGFTLALLADARNQDELAFVLGHEAAHHIAGHIPLAQQSASEGALVGGLLATLGGLDPQSVDAVAQLGATVGARRFSKEFELEADSLGTVIAARAGYSPVRGAAFFNRIPDPGDRFLGSHPPNADRIRVVQATAARIGAY